MEIDYSKLFEYNDGKSEIPGDAFRISPSGVEKFFSDKVTWYSENLLGAPKKFTSSTSTVLGTVVHACCEVVANSQTTGENYDSDALEDAIEAHITSYEGKEDYDTDKIRANWRNMAEALIKEYIIGNFTVATENFVKHEITQGVYIGGTYDAITSTAPNDNLLNPVGRLTLRDWKTASSKPSSFNWAYTLQAYAYAYALHKKGVVISDVELCFAVLPTKTLPVRVFKFTRPFDKHAYDLIDGILHLVGDSVQCFKDYPDLRYLLMGDYRQKVNDIPRPETEITTEIAAQTL